jgi:hypothetical protein
MAESQPDSRVAYFKSAPPDLDFLPCPGRNTFRQLLAILERPPYLVDWLGFARARARNRAGPNMLNSSLQPPVHTWCAVVRSGIAGPNRSTATHPKFDRVGSHHLSPNRDERTLDACTVWRNRCFRLWLPAELRLEWIEDGDARWLEIRNIARHHDEAMFQRGRGDRKIKLLVTELCG